MLEGKQQVVYTHEVQVDQTLPISSRGFLEYMDHPSQDFLALLHLQSLWIDLGVPATNLWSFETHP